MTARVKPTKKKPARATVKPVKAWGIVQDNKTLPEWIYLTKADARHWLKHLYGGGRVVPVEIRVID